MLYAFLDESGTHGTAHTLSVSGYISTLDQWEAFELEWKKSLTIYEVPFFHMTDFLAGKKQFLGWVPPEKFRRLHCLIDIINGSVLGSFSITIPMALYRQAMAQKNTVIRNAYHLAAMHIFSQVASWADKSGVPRSERIVYAFESGADGSDYVKKAHDIALADEQSRDRFRLIQISFPDKKQVVQLQAADILANTINRDVPRRLKLSDDLRPVWDAEISTHLFQKKTTWEYMTREDLARMIEPRLQLPEPPKRTRRRR